MREQPSSWNSYLRGKKERDTNNISEGTWLYNHKEQVTFGSSFFGCYALSKHTSIILLHKDGMFQVCWIHYTVLNSPDKLWEVPTLVDHLNCNTETATHEKSPTNNSVAESKMLPGVVAMVKRTIK